MGLGGQGMQMFFISILQLGDLPLHVEQYAIA